ncbi:MAG: hypothetical protein WAO98_05915, partial [Alphaproteobacteria bacterium]
MSVDFAPRFFQRTIYPFCLIILAATFLVGCNDEKTRNLIDQRAAAAQKAMGEMANYDSPKRYNPLVITDKVWTGNSALRMHRGMPIPTKFEGDKGITLISAEPMTLSEIAGAISAQTGIPVRQTEVGSTSGGRGAAAAAAAAGGASNAPTMPMAYEGSLSGLMEKVAGNFGVNWRFDGASISISRFE